MRAVAVAVLALSIVLLIGVLGGRTRVTAQPSPLTIVLTLDHTAYEPGTPIGFTVTVTNISGHPVTVTFPTTQRFDLSIQSPAVEVEVARWSAMQTFQPATVRQTWAPGEVITYAGTWLPVSTLLPASNLNSAGQFIRRGVFRVSAQLTDVEIRPVSRAETLIIGASVALDAGCTTIAPSFFADLPVSIIVRAINPPGALQSLWQRSIHSGTFTAYQPAPQVVNDLVTVNGRNSITVCLTAPGRIFVA